MDTQFKPKIGIFGLTGCGGDQLTILNIEDSLLELLGRLELVEFQMGSSRRGGGALDIAFIEGSVSTRTDLKRLMEIRDRATYLVAIGNCSIDGCIQASLNGLRSTEERVRDVYGKDEFDSELLDPKGVAEYVKVDFKLPGCPMEKDEFLHAIASMLHGDLPREVTYPVCVECKLNEYPCLITERGLPCLGPVARGGCKARCPGLNVECIGCRGPRLEQANIAKEFKLLLEKGYGKEYLLNRLRLFGGNVDEIRRLLEVEP